MQRQEEVGDTIVPKYSVDGSRAGYGKRAQGSAENKMAVVETPMVERRGVAASRATGSQAGEVRRK